MLGLPGSGHRVNVCVCVLRSEILCDYGPSELAHN
jgi:hypothetical protein